jgi:hypothetical protein
MIKPSLRLMLLQDGNPNDNDSVSYHCMQIRVVSQKMVIENPNKC